MRQVGEFGVEYSQVEVRLPGAWGVAGCQPVGQVLRSAKSTLLPGSTTQLVLQQAGERVTALQPSNPGCGLPGLGVHLPTSILSQPNLDQSLAEQIINNRFGLYSENLTVFSNTSDWDSVALNRQNLECNGHGPLDLLPGREQLPVNWTEPEWSYVMRGEQHFVLVLEATSVMEQRWSTVKRGFYRFINNLKEGTMLSIITYGRAGSLVLPPTLVTEANREGLHGRIPRRTEDVDLVCLSCGLQLAKDVLAGSGGRIVLVTGSPVSGQDLSTVSGIYTILYGVHGQQEVLDGSVYSIQEGTRSSQLQLNEILLDVMNREAEAGSLAKIHESTHLSYEFSGTFTVEENLREDLTVTLSLQDEEKVEYFEVTDPSGEKKIFSKFEDGMVFLRFPGLSLPGIWSYHAKLYGEAGLPSARMAVDVVGRGSWEEVEVTGFIVRPVLEKNGGVQLLAQVRRGELVVHGARVVALVSGPGQLEEQEVLLRDTEDGIYSGLLKRFSNIPGYYTVRIQSSDNQGQAYTSPDTATRRPTGPFFRLTASTSIYIGFGVEEGEDILPPSRILDLRVMNSTDTNSTDSLNSTSVELSWTAPGGDYSQGQVSFYQIRCHPNPLVLLDQWEEQGILATPSDLVPGPAGGVETARVRVPWTGEVFYYAVMGLDGAGNQAGPSNLVQVYLEDPPVPELQEEQSAPNLKLAGGPSWFLDQDQMLLLGGVVGGVLLMVVLLVLVLILRARRRTAVKVEWEDTYEAGFSPDKAGEDKVEPETESGIYSWLESLPRSQQGRTKDSLDSWQHQHQHHQEEASSNSSRPTTSTDDSISDSGDTNPRSHPEGQMRPAELPNLRPEEVSHDDYAQQVLTRSLHYYSVRGRDRRGLAASREGIADYNGSVYNYNGSIAGFGGSIAGYAASVSGYNGSAEMDYNNQVRKKRHESVV